VPPAQQFQRIQGEPHENYIFAEIDSSVRFRAKLFSAACRVALYAARQPIGGCPSELPRCAGTDPSLNVQPRRFKKHSVDMLDRGSYRVLPLRVVAEAPIVDPVFPCTLLMVTFRNHAPLKQTTPFGAGFGKASASRRK
jgi:hypothetical protein